MELLTLFIAYPLAASAVAGILLALALVRRRVLPGIVALLWAGYSYYEYLMHTRVLCSGECNIRVDLLLIYPMLAVVTLWSVVSAMRKKSR